MTNNKQSAIKFISDGETVEINSIPRRIKSPVRREDDPEWSIYFHAREKDGVPFVSGTQNCDLEQMALSLAIWINVVCKANKADPIKFSDGMTEALKLIAKESAIGDVEVCTKTTCHN